MFFQKLADGHRADARRAAAALEECPAKSDAIAGIMLPAILAVEDHADQRGLAARHAPPDAAHAVDEVRSRGVGLAPLVVEADQIAQHMVAEDDAQLGRALAHSIGLVELLGPVKLSVCL